MIYVCHVLDTITKLSPTVCIILCEVDVTDDIYNMILRNNRSLPWMNICLRACSILITLAKDPDTRKYVVMVSLETEELCLSILHCILAASF